MGKNKIDKFLDETIILEECYSNKLIFKRYDVLKEVKNNENKVNKLFERKGVAMYNFKMEIQGIVDYILKEFYNRYSSIEWEKNYIIVFNKRYECLSGTKNINFQIPKQLTKKVDFIKDLNINVNILPLKNINIDNKTQTIVSINSSAEVGNFKNLNFFKNKLRKGYVECGLISFNGVLKPENVSLKLYHELGHYFQDFNLQRNKSSLGKQTVRDSYYSNKNIFITSENEYIKKIGNILYSLFNKSELSQHASSIYGELIELNPNIKDINNSLKYTTTYNWYKQLYEEVNELDKYPSIDIWEATRKFYKTKSHPNGYENLDGYVFKEKFIKLSIKYLNVFYRKMMNAVELYVEEKSQ